MITQSFGCFESKAAIISLMHDICVILDSGGHPSTAVVN